MSYLTGENGVDDGIAESLRAIEQLLRDRAPRSWRFNPTDDDGDDDTPGDLA